jgi:alkanesulfonate monooxygenase SsuD/methylene tetrahydromethanopterin reductase-like flavin-dependent oxidoreductase (luciferase family)
LNPIAVSQDRQRAKKLIDSSARSFILRHSKRLSRELGYDKAWSKLHEIPEEVIDACFTFGTSEDCANKIRGYLKAGATYIILQTILPKGIDTLRKVAEDLLRK